MTSKWETVRLGDVAETLLGKTLPRGAGQTLDGNSYLRNVNVQWGKIEAANLNRMPFTDLERRKYSLKKGDILLCEGGEVGRCAILDADMPDIYFQNAIHRIRTKPAADSSFVVLALEQLVKSGGLDGITSQVTIAHLNQMKLRGLQFSLPPLADQQRIVDLIGALDDAIEAAEDLLDSTWALRLTATRSLLNGGPLVSISDIAVVSQGRGLPKDVQGKISGCFSWFKIADMTRSANLFGYVEAETRMSLEEIVELKGRLAPAGSVVFPRVGAAVLTEKKRILETDAALDENHIILTPTPGVPPELLLAALENLKLGSLVQTGAVPSLNMKLIRETKISWAKQDQLSEIGEICTGTRVTLRAATTHAGSLRKLRSELLTALLSCAHTIPDSYDEVMTAAEELVTA